MRINKNLVINCFLWDFLNSRLTYEVQGGTFFNEKGGIRKKWLWEDESSFIQPLVLNFNSFITLKVTSQVKVYYFNHIERDLPQVDHLYTPTV